MASASADVIDLNVGGHPYTTSLVTLRKYPNCQLAVWFSQPDSCTLQKDKQGRYFIDRDGELFRYILDYLRNGHLRVPDRFHERFQLSQEAEFYKLDQLKALLTNEDTTEKTSDECIDMLSSTGLNGSKTGYITVGYQGTFSFGRQGMGADINFRKINRILICGRVGLCREVFGDTLNEGRDPDRGHSDRYTARFYLKHSFLEQAFDMLNDCGFKLIGSCASGTSGVTDTKPGANTEEERWAHYNEFIFYRE